MNSPLNLFKLCFLFKQKTPYEMRISDWSSDVCSSDLDPDKTGLADARAIRDADRLLLRDGKKPGAPEEEETNVCPLSPSFADWATTHAETLAPPKDLSGWLRQMTSSR